MGFGGFSAWPFLSRFLNLKLVLVVVTALAAMVLINRQFAGDRNVSSAVDMTWKSDGATPALVRAGLALTSEPPAIDDAEAAATDALDESPLSVAALESLAAVAEARGDQASVRQYRALILARSYRSFPTLVWNYNDALQHRDFATTMAMADAILRQQPSGSGSGEVMRALAVLSGDPQAEPYLLKVLSPESPWRLPAIQQIAASGPVDVFPDIMRGLPDLAEPDATAAWSAYLDRLIQQGMSRRAYVEWADLLKPEQLSSLGLLFDGGFEADPSGYPFDWTVQPLKGVEISFDPDSKSEGNRSLHVEFGGGRLNFANVRQSLILDPGSYRLSGSVRSEDLQTERGVSWRIYCVNGGMATGDLAVSPSFSGTADWRPFSVEFSVPATGCDDQVLQLELPARIAAERQIRGDFWTDNLAIVRTSGGQS